MTSSRPDLNPESVTWDNPARQAAFEQWLHPVSAAHGLLPHTVRLASADASFRRYLRVDAAAGASCIIMDAPPDKENCQPFVSMAQRLQRAGVPVPEVLAWDEPQGFMLLSDLGSQTLLTVLDPQQPTQALPYFKNAVDLLLRMQQQATTEGLPAYDAALLQR